MALDAWLPIGFRLPDGAKTRAALFGGANWQILETQGDGRALVAHEDLGARWLESSLIETGLFSAFDFGDHRL